ncbi:hypothetical protein SLEP1_g39519 [Rubroshorea leprosula]|uniref:beta-ketoacyl-[acyl-carrier-protein] synthase I n=1 Tax=Rubroshorea leprosula TaxID=152421 RepID=A0AAV5L0Q8_9ROSI|nr:hypothetical protein SLEP1_g39519 [Rubroshorea leprosula]
MARPSCRKFLTTSRFHITRHISSSSSCSEALPPPPIPSPRRVVVTGTVWGWRLRLVAEWKTTWKRLMEGNCWIRAITPEDLKMGAFDRETQLHIFDQMTSKVAATVPCGMGSGDFNEELCLNSKVKLDLKLTVRLPWLSMSFRGDEALKDARWLPIEQEEKERTGPNHAAVTSSATGAHSIGDATRMIQFGDSDVTVAGSTESSIDALSIAGFFRYLNSILTRKLKNNPW